MNFCVCVSDKEGLLTFHSNPQMAMPAAAAVPAIPTKWTLPMLLAKSEAPICGEHQRKNTLKNNVLKRKCEINWREQCVIHL